MTNLNMRKLNRIWRKIHKGGTNGVKLETKIRDVLEFKGIPVPANKRDRIAKIAKVINANLPIDRVRAKALRLGNKPKKDDFYASWEWKKARYSALKTHGRKCLCCGWQPGDTLAGHLVVDHIKPRSKFPELALDPDNLQVLCNDCNMGKSNDNFDDWREMEERYRATIQ